ncbi:MAG: hypothetical protein ABJC05_02205 [Pyrinomonadaceae bacterium]
MTNAFASFILRFSSGMPGHILAIACVLTAFGSAFGQSTEQDRPTPVRASDISAAIAVRDLGDARLTRHFYIFTATPGDLLISVEGKNLNGDVDIFTSVGFRPLAKLSLYASEVAAKTTKSIYLRARQDLILRVEARSPNDEEGNYRIQFGGSFEPFSGEISTGDNSTPADETPTLSASSKKGKRASAVGARIEEPPAPIQEPPAAIEEKADQPKVEAPAATAEKTEPVRTARGKKPTRTRPPRSGRKPAAAAANVEGGVSEKAETNTPSIPSAPEGGEKSGETGKSASGTPDTPATQAEPGPRLIIEIRDGEKIERSMSTVRRVVIDNGQIIVILKTGKIERVPMISVTRMSIEP